jgi:GT2 family glycosyltransferase
MVDAPLVCVVIVNWNGKEDTLECLDSVMELDYPRYEVIVVDNASDDGSPEAIKAEFPEVTLLVNKINLGFAGGSNVGICRALARGCEYIFLLNNDTVVDSSLLKELVTGAESAPKVGIVGPKVYYYGQHGKLWSVGAKKHWLRMTPTTIGLDEEDQGQYDAISKVDYIFGCGMLVKRIVLEEVGLLDPRYFAYYEDLDLCLRAKRQGYDVVWAPEAKMWHKVSAATRTIPYAKEYHFARSRVLFIMKHGRGLHLLIVLLCELPHLFRIILSRILQRELKNAWAYVKGWLNGFVSSLLILLRGTDEITFV